MAAEGSAAGLSGGFRAIETETANFPYFLLGFQNIFLCPGPLSDVFVDQVQHSVSQIGQKSLGGFAGCACQCRRQGGFVQIAQGQLYFKISYR